MTTLAPPDTRRRLVTAGMAGLVAALWTITEIMPTFLSPGRSLYQVVWVRYATHILVMLAVLAPRRGWSLLRTRRPALQVGRGLLMLVMPACFIASIGRAHISDVLAVFWVAPLLTLALAALLQRDRARWPGWVAAASGSLGAQLVIRPGAGVLGAGLYGLGMGASFSLYVVLTRALREERTETNLLYSAASVFVPLTLALPAFWSPLSAHDALLMAAVGVAGLGALWALDRATTLAPVSALAPLLPLQVVAMLVLAPLLAGHEPAKLALAGAALIVGAAAAALLLTARPGAAADPAAAAAMERA